MRTVSPGFLEQRVSWVWPIISALPVEWAAVTLSRWGWVVKDVNLVLRGKEMDIVRLRKEIEALHLAIPVLAENRDWVERGLASRPPSSESQGTGTTGLPRHLVSDSRLRISAIWHSANQDSDRAHLNGRRRQSSDHGGVAQITK